jgi:uncharacterized protein (DUF433 family)
MKPLLGEGVFTIKDASFILNIPPHKVRGALNEYWNGIFSSSTQSKSSWGTGRTRSINFYSLIEIKTFFALRELGLTAQSISKSHIILAEYLNNPYPFANATLKTDRASIMFEHNDTLISADKKLQAKIKEVINPFCETIDYGLDLMAERMYPKGRNVDIVVDPHHQMGQPTIKDSNILAESIYKMYIANENPVFIAELYELEMKEVNDAIHFYKDAA